MVLNSSGEMIGDGGVTLQEVDGQAFPQMGYQFRRDMWGQGLAPEAARAGRDYGLIQLKADLLISLIDPEKLPSGKIAGAERDEDLEGEHAAGNAASRLSRSATDVDRMALARTVIPNELRNLLCWGAQQKADSWSLCCSE